MFSSGLVLIWAAIIIITTVTIFSNKQGRYNFSTVLKNSVPAKDMNTAIKYDLDQFSLLAPINKANYGLDNRQMVLLQLLAWASFHLHAYTLKNCSPEASGLRMDTVARPLRRLRLLSRERLHRFNSQSGVMTRFSVPCPHNVALMLNLPVSVIFFDKECDAVM